MRSEPRLLEVGPVIHAGLGVRVREVSDAAAGVAAARHDGVVPVVTDLSDGDTRVTDTTDDHSCRPVRHTTPVDSAEDGGALDLRGASSEQGRRAVADAGADERPDEHLSGA